MGCLHDPANVQQTSSKCNAGRLLEVFWTLDVICYNGAVRLLDHVNTLLGTFFLVDRKNVVQLNSLVLVPLCVLSLHHLLC